MTECIVAQFFDSLCTYNKALRRATPTTSVWQFSDISVIIHVYLNMHIFMLMYVFIFGC